MKQKEIKELASKIIDLEQKCQIGENISDNMNKMDELINKLSIFEIMQINDYIENNLHF